MFSSYISMFFMVSFLLGKLVVYFNVSFMIDMKLFFLVRMLFLNVFISLMFIICIIVLGNDLNIYFFIVNFLMNMLFVGFFFVNIFISMIS